MPAGDRLFSEEAPFPQSEESSNREDLAISISPLRRQVETPFSSQANSRI